MRRGISPIVAVVLLIAISVIGAVGAYFWVGGLVTQQPTSSKPVVINANPLGNGDILITNLGQSTFDGTLYSTDPNITIDCPSILPSQRGVCNVTGITTADSFHIYAPGASAILLETAAVFPDQTGGIWSAPHEYTWTNGLGTGVWEDGRNWGEPDRRDYPQGNGHKVIFNSGATANCTTSEAITVGEIEMQSGYTGTLTLGGALTIDDASSQDGGLAITGTLNTSDYALTVDGQTSITGTLNAGASTVSLGSGVTSGFALTLNGGTFNGGSGTHTIGSAWLSSSTVTFSSGTTTIDSRDNATLNVGLGFAYTTFDDGNGTLVFTYPGDVLLHDTAGTARTFYNLIINNGAGNKVQYRNGYGFHLTVDNDLTITSGTFETTDASSGTSRDLTVGGLTDITGTLNTNASTVSLGSGVLGYTVVLRSGALLDGGSGTHTYGGLQAFTGSTLTWSSGTTTMDGLNHRIFDFGMPTVNVGTSTVEIATTEDAVIGYQVGSYTYFYNLVINTANSVEIYRATTATISNDLTITQGNLTTASGAYTSNLIVTGDTSISGTFIGNSATISLSSLAIPASGTYSATSGTTTLTGLGNFDGAFVHNNGSLVLAGGHHNQYLGGESFWNLTTSGSHYMKEDITVENVMTLQPSLFGTHGGSRTVTLGNDYQSGTLTGTTVFKSMTKSGSTTIQAANQSYPVNVATDIIDWDSQYGGIPTNVYVKWVDLALPTTTGGGGVQIYTTGDCNFSGLTISANDNFTNTAGKITMSGDWVNSGNFTHGDGEVEFDATASLTSGISAFNNITISAGTTTTTDDATVNYTYIASGATLVIDTGDTYTCNLITNDGTLTVNGAKTC